MVTEKKTTTADGKTLLDLILNRDEVFRKEEPEKFLLSLEDTRFIVNIYYDYLRMIKEAAPLFKSAEDGKIERSKVLKEVRDNFLSKGYDKEKVLSVCEAAFKKDYWCTTLTSLNDIKKPVFTYEIESNKRELQGKKVDIYEAPATLTEKYKVFNIPDNVFYALSLEVNALKGLYNVFVVPDSEILEDTENYLLLPTNKIANIFTENFKDESKFEIETDIYNDNTTLTYALKSGKLIASIDSKLSTLSPDLDKTLKFAMNTYMKQGASGSYLTLDSKDFMDIMGFSDRKSANKLLKSCVDEMSSFSFTWDTENDSGKMVLFSEYRCTGRGEGSKKYIIHLGTLFKLAFEYDKQNHDGKMLGYYPESLFKLKGLTYQIGAAIFRFKRMNLGRESENKISVRTLKDNISISTPENVKDKGHMSRYTIAPITKALEELTKKGILKEWYLMKRKSGNKSIFLTNEELEKAEKDTEFFDSLMIYFRLEEEPDYTHLIEKKQQQKALNKPKRGRKKSNNK